MNTRIFSFLILFLAATPALFCQAEIDLSLGYVMVGKFDSTLSLDPMSPDSFVKVEPGRLYALKGESEQITFSFSDGREPEVHEFYSVRYAGNPTSPEFAPPPLSKLSRREDGWLTSSSFVPRAVAYAPLAESMEVFYPFYACEALEANDFYTIYDQKPSGLTNDALKRYLDKRLFELPFENGSKKQFNDSTFIVGKDTIRHKINYLGQYDKLGVYLLEHSKGKKKWFDLVRKSDGGSAGQVDFPQTTPAFSENDSYLMTSTSSADGLDFYLRFYQMDIEEPRLVEKFTVRMPLNRPAEICWESENILLMRVEQTGQIRNAEEAERFYKVFITISN